MTDQSLGTSRTTAPNLADYDSARAEFSWDRARHLLDGLPDGGLNIAHEAVERHAAGPRRSHVALRCLSRHGGDVRDLTYADLSELTNRFANVLDGLGVGAGEVVFTLSGRVPELYVAVLGTLKHRSVASPLFSAFGPEPIRQRIARGDGRVLVTTRALYERKVASVRGELPGLQHVLLLDSPGNGTGVLDSIDPSAGASGAGQRPSGDLPPGTLSLGELMAAADPHYRIGPTDPQAMALLHFTSGTTGTPKGAIHVHEAVVAHHVTGRLVLDLHPNDVFWCTADPGWVTGTSYGIISPLTHGVTTIVDEGEFDAERWYRTLQDQRVTVWYTAPTAIRMLMKAGPELPAGFDLSHLRLIASVGEPLNPEAVVWGRQVLGLPILDNWWQTETGGIMIANYPSMPVRPGSMGRPLPGIEAAIVQRDEHGKVVLDADGRAVPVPAGTEGELVLRPGWPSMLRGYLHDDERYAKCFAGGWYCSGDLARVDDDGYFWFIGRGDDVIKSAGHLIGPFEVESVLMEHPAVAEAGVIGVPDPVAGEVVKAFVTLRHGFTASDELRTEIMALARRRLGPAVAPRSIELRDTLPRTRSGKIMRRLLKARELGLPEGDLSTLEDGS
jgi:acetyl-CoA synthetase